MLCQARQQVEEVSKPPKRKETVFYNTETQKDETVLLEGMDIEAHVKTHKRPITTVKRFLWCEIAPDGTRLGRFFYFTDGACWPYDMAKGA